MTKGKTHKVVRFLISPKKKKEKIEVNKIMNPTAGSQGHGHRKTVHERLELWFAIPINQFIIFFYYILNGD